MATKKSSSSTSSSKMKKGETRTAPKKTAEYKEKYANKNPSTKTSSTSSQGSSVGGAGGILGALSGMKETTKSIVSEYNKRQNVTQTSGRETQIQAAIDFINSQDLSADVKAMYIDAVQNWDPSKELNPQNIIDTFNKIKKSTIDPRYQGLLNIAVQSIQSASKYAAAQRTIELETQQANLLGETKSTQDNLEASGLTFSGKGVEYLGSKGAAVIPFGGEDIEGLISQKHRLIGTSSEARYKQSIKEMGLSAEEQLGSSATKGLIDGYSPVGSVTGSLNESKQAAEGAALGNLIGQGVANSQQDYTLTA